MSPPFQFREGTLTLTLRVQPGAGKTEMAGLHGEGALRLRISAPAVEGKANRACVRFLAKALGVPPGSVTILRGETSRNKLVRITCVCETRCQSLLQTWVT